MYRAIWQELGNRRKTGPNHQMSKSTGMHIILIWIIIWHQWCIHQWRNSFGRQFHCSQNRHRSNYLAYIDNRSIVFLVFIPVDFLNTQIDRRNTKKPVVKKTSIAIHSFWCCEKRLSVCNLSLLHKRGVLYISNHPVLFCCAVIPLALYRKMNACMFMRFLVIKKIIYLWWNIRWSKWLGHQYRCVPRCV